MNKAHSHIITKILFIIFLVMIFTVITNTMNAQTPFGQHDDKNIHKAPADKAANKVKSDELKKTVISAYINKEILPDKNLIYCGSFKLAWNELRDNIVKEDIAISGNPLLVKLLKKEPFSKQDISDEFYVAMSGTGKDDIIDKINKSLKEKFKNEAPFVDIKMDDPKDIFIYAFLFKELNFDTTFETTDIFFKTTDSDIFKKFKGFGIFNKFNSNHEKLLKQVDLLYYEDKIANNPEFIIKLNTKSQNDEIILAEIKPERTLLQTIKQVENKIKNPNNKKPFGNIAGDELKIPKINFDIEHSYSEITDKKILNKTLPSYTPGDYYKIKQALQDIKFRLNENGALLKSSSQIYLNYGGASLNMNKLRPRKLVFNRPFLIYLKEKHAANPYLAIWVNNPEILVSK